MIAKHYVHRYDVVFQGFFGVEQDLSGALRDTHWRLARSAEGFNDEKEHVALQRSTSESGLVRRRRLGPVGGRGILVSPVPRFSASSAPAGAKAYKAVNVALIDTYWAVGAYLSQKVGDSGWGKGIVKELADWLLARAPDLKGFSASNLWRMKQFYEAYSDDPKAGTTGASFAVDAYGLRKRP